MQGGQEMDWERIK